MGVISKQAKNPLSKWLSWLEAQPSWRFWLILYLLRWLVILPVGLLNDRLFPGQGGSFSAGLLSIPPAALFLLAVSIAPLYETLLECSIPYWVLRKLTKLDGRAWIFVVVSADIMALLHPLPSATLPSLATGVFLAYTYRHFALQSQLKGFGWTALFHAGINVVGFAFILLEVLKSSNNPLP